MSIGDLYECAASALEHGRPQLAALLEQMADELLGQAALRSRDGRPT